MERFNKKQVFKWKSIKVLGYFAYFVGIISTVLYFNVAWVPTFLIVLLSGFIFIIDIAETKEKSYKNGEAGELAVEQVLQTIPNIKFYRDISIGEDVKWNIDFVVVASNGVFVLEVKTYDGRITSNGDIWYQFRNSRRHPVSSFSKQAKSNSYNLINYMKEKYSDAHFPYFNPVVVLTRDYKESDIEIEDGKYTVVSLGQLKSLFETAVQPNSDIVNVFEKEFRTTVTS